MFPGVLLWLVLGLNAVNMVSGNPENPLGPVNATSEEPFWMEVIKHQGTAPFHPHTKSYKVFRNVKEFGAKGDGVADDTEAINQAISSGGRCGGGNCDSSTVSPAIVYFPKGTYLVSAPIIAYYYTQLIGDAKIPPTILAAPGFSGFSVIDADPYIPGGNGSQWYTNQNNFYRSIRNLIIDTRQTPSSASTIALHWQVSQATSLMNVVIQMSRENNTGHQGIWMENGSGGYMGDIIIHGGKYGFWGGNQQFTVRNITINHANTAIFGVWNWGWTFQGVTINNCQVGFDLKTGGLTSETQSVGAEAIIDAVINDTPIFIRSSASSNGELRGSLVLNNIKLHNVPVAVGTASGEVVLNGGTRHIKSWGQGNIYSGTDSKGDFVQDNIVDPEIPRILRDHTGRIFGKTHPQYEHFPASRFISVKDHGAKGDGKTDDTAALQAVLNKAVGRKIVFIDAGMYIVTKTLTIPAGSRIVGEAWSVIAGRGKAFHDQDNPQVVVKVGEEGSRGFVEITDIVFSTVGPAPGAIVVEWNVHEPHGHQGACGMWDSHIRLGGAAGTNLEASTCAGNSDPKMCSAAFLALYLRPRSSAYLEGTWVWLADHDLDGGGQLTLYSGRGILSESAGPVWMIGTAEHHVLYQYSLVGAKNHFMGLIQTETPYYQPEPAVPQPFEPTCYYNDPDFPPDLTSSWGLWIEESQDITIFGAGLYSFFRNYTQECLTDKTCQTQIANIDSGSSVNIYSLSTVGITYQLSVEQEGVIRQGDNINGFAQTVTLWSSDNSMDGYQDGGLIDKLLGI